MGKYQNRVLALQKSQGGPRKSHVTSKDKAKSLVTHYMRVGQKYKKTVSTQTTAKARPFDMSHYL